MEAAHINFLPNIFKCGDNYDGGTSVFDLQYVCKDLIEVLIIILNHKYDCCLFFLIKHTQRSMPELSRGVVFSMQTRNLIEFLSQKLSNIICSSL